MESKQSEFTGEKVIQVLYHNQARKISVRKDTNLVQTLINVFALDETSKLVLFKSDISIDINFGTVEDKQIYNLQVTSLSITPVVKFKPNESFKGLITKVFEHNPNEGEILYSLTGLPLPPFPYLKEITISEFLNPLPAEIQSNNRPDLRLLSGDLDEVHSHSQCVKTLLEKLDLSGARSYFNPQLILSGSGVGKTKALFDFLKEKFGIFIDCTRGNEGKDVKDMFRRISDLVAKQNIKNLDEVCGYEVQLTIVSRAVALSLFLLNRSPIQPSNWLFAQMNGIVSVHYDEFLGVIRDQLRYRIPFENRSQFISLFEFVSRQINHRLPVVIDEANILLKKHVNEFRSIRDPSKKPCRPLFTLLISTLTEIPSTALIVAGTKLDLKESEYWESLVAKMGSGSPIYPEIYHELPLADKNRSKKLIRRLFAPEFVEKAHALLHQYLPPPIRYRLITSWVDSYVPKKSSLEESIKEFKKDLLNSDSPWSLKYMVNDFVLQQSKKLAQNLFCELVMSPLVGGGVLKSTSVEWMAGGFCRITLIEGSFKYIVEESVVIQAVSQYLGENQISLCDYFIKEIFDTDNPSTTGIMMDTLLSLCFLELGDNPYFIEDCTGICQPIWQHKVNDIIRLNNKNDGDFNTLFNDLDGKVYYILPKHYLGPDGIVLVNQILYVIGIKTTQRHKRSVDLREVNLNYETTDLDNFRFDVKEKEEFFNLLEFLSPLAIIRLHIVFPTASKNATMFDPGLRLLCSEQIIHIGNQEVNLKVPQFVMDVDVSNAHEIGLFRTSVLDVLKQKFPFQL
eukprot:TRINITY_DN308_c0_g1_i3.p1 TRINITY_DN308_c0_g1~~TRINITY_DN308_c0_g1_i3.p1  ORF type:complete len:794 (-),score=140.70 TRINITY_DN308_c0_g1_i3:36-2417(-)